MFDRSATANPHRGRRRSCCSFAASTEEVLAVGTEQVRAAEPRSVDTSLRPTSAETQLPTRASQYRRDR
jgi:hypothetical protein